MSEKKLKFDNIMVNKKEFHKSKQPIALMSVNVDQVVTKALNILLATKKVKLLNRYALSYLKCVDTSNTLKTVSKKRLF